MTVHQRLWLCVSVCLLAACSSQREFMPTPNLYVQGDAPALFGDLDPSLQTPEMSLLYVTDRSRETDENGNLAYGWGRSHSIAWGVTEVAVRPEVSWEELVRISLEPERSQNWSIDVVSIEERGRFPPTPWPARVTGAQVDIYPEVLEKNLEQKAKVEEEIRRRLAASPRKEVMLYVHGYNNGFEDAAVTMAEVWHFLGRETVPILYTWPAGKGGATGYTYDRESGEFTIYHLKAALRLLASMPEIEHIQLLSHSRGTDVLSTAMRELILVERGAGRDPLETLRVENLVMAAPDLDMDVVSQRFIAEYLGTGVGEITVYTAEDDKAINIAERLFQSRQRIGRLSIENLSMEDREVLKFVEDISFVRLEEVADRTGHGYFHNSPEASSDLILTLRFGRDPGAENGRPLESTGPRFWLLRPGYPFAREAGDD